MTPGELKHRFDDLRVWHTKEQRAPHKPLPVLWAIGRCLRNEARLAPYAEIEGDLGELLRRFDRPKVRVNPHHPFWHLRNDGVWEIPEAKRIAETSKGDAHIRSLRQEGARGGLPEKLFLKLRKDPATALDIARSLLGAHFPETLHRDILRAVGIDGAEAQNAGREFDAREGTDGDFDRVRRRRRDSAFSGAVLAAYGAGCAVCEFSARLDGAPVALDAAHIKWHQAGGPDRVSNGLALCALHHRLFDAGAFTLCADFTVNTAPTARGPGWGQTLEPFSGRQIRLPRERADYPDPKSLRWHRREVFRSFPEYDESRQQP